MIFDFRVSSSCCKKKRNISSRHIHISCGNESQCERNDMTLARFNESFLGTLGTVSNFSSF